MEPAACRCRRRQRTHLCSSGRKRDTPQVAPLASAWCPLLPVARADARPPAALPRCSCLLLTLPPRPPPLHPAPWRRPRCYRGGRWRARWRLHRRLHPRCCAAAGAPLKATQQGPAGDKAPPVPPSTRRAPADDSDRGGWVRLAGGQHALGCRRLQNGRRHCIVAALPHSMQPAAGRTARRASMHPPAAPPPRGRATLRSCPRCAGLRGRHRAPRRALHPPAGRQERQRQLRLGAACVAGPPWHSHVPTQCMACR